MGHKIQEDNWNGLHHFTTHGRINEAPTPSDIDDPVPVTGMSMPHGGAGGYVKPGRGGDVDFTFNLFSNNRVEKNLSGGAAGGNGVEWFADNLKSVAIVAAGATALYALAKLIKALNRSVKVRFNKAVKSLQKAQMDFVNSDFGVDMKNVLPGQGSRIYDWFSRLITLSLFAKRYSDQDAQKFNIGLKPFCYRYKQEIQNDFNAARDAFNKIAAASKATKAGESSTPSGQAGPTKNTIKNTTNSGTHESADVVYSSFREAFASDRLNEGAGAVNESLALAAASLGASLLFRGGMFLYRSLGKNGQPDDKTEKKVQVTKESVREICYAILQNFLDKYVNMEAVFAKLGIDSKSLGDLNASSCEKLKACLEKYQKPEPNLYTKQYGRLNKAYTNMLDHYYKIGDGIISNFAKYTDAKDEKHSNLLVAGKEKLQGMWDAQKDFFNSNFSHIIIEIVSSDEYITYLNFIIEQVLPVFKTGLAGDADYILDAMPKKDEYYVVRQTTENPWLQIQKKGRTGQGNWAIAKVLGFDRENQKIKFKLIGAIDGEYKVDNNGMITLPPKTKIDYSIYKNDEGKDAEYDADYPKWLSIDPMMMDWTEKTNSPVYRKDQGNGVIDYVYAVGSHDTEYGEYSDVICVRYHSDKDEYDEGVDIKLDKPMSADGLASLIEKVGLNPKTDVVSPNNQYDKKFAIRAQGLKNREAKADSHDDAVGLIKKALSGVGVGEKSDEAVIKNRFNHCSDIFGVKGKSSKDIVMAVPDVDGSNGTQTGDMPVLYVYRISKEGEEYKFYKYFISGHMTISEFNENMKKCDNVMLDDKTEPKERYKKVCIAAEQSDKFTDEIRIDADKFIPEVIEKGASVDSDKGSADRSNVYYSKSDDGTENVFYAQGDGDKAELYVDTIKNGNHSYSKLAFDDANFDVKDFDDACDKTNGINVMKQNADAYVQNMSNANVPVGNPGGDLKTYMSRFIGSATGGGGGKKSGNAPEMEALEKVVKDIERSKEDCKNSVHQVGTYQNETNDNQRIEIDGKERSYCLPYNPKFGSESINSGLVKKNNGQEAEKLVFKYQLVGLLPIGADKLPENKDVAAGYIIKLGDKFGFCDFDKDDIRSVVRNVFERYIKGSGFEIVAQEQYVEPTAKPDDQTQINSSVEYEVIDKVDEGDSHSLTVNRKIDGSLRKWFVLSESVCSINESAPELSKAYVRRNMNSRDDVMKYVKSSDTARIVRFTESETYSVPMTPGYRVNESVLLLRFNAEGDVTDKVYLGNHNIV